MYVLTCIACVACALAGYFAHSAIARQADASASRIYARVASRRSTDTTDASSNISKRRGNRRYRDSDLRQRLAGLTRLLVESMLEDEVLALVVNNRQALERERDHHGYT